MLQGKFPSLVPCWVAGQMWQTEFVGDLLCSPRNKIWNSLNFISLILCRVLSFSEFGLTPGYLSDPPNPLLFPSFYVYSGPLTDPLVVCSSPIFYLAQFTGFRISWEVVRYHGPMLVELGIAIRDRIKEFTYLLSFGLNISLLFRPSSEISRSISRILVFTT